MSESAGWLYNSDVNIPLAKNHVYAFGRSPHDENDERVYRIEINEPYLSFTHCYIWVIQFDNVSNNICYFKDMSRNGCSINGVVVGKGICKIVSHGDVIKLHDGIQFKYKSVAAEREANTVVEVKNWRVLPVVIGFGTFGKVQVAVNKKEEGKMYAVKTIASSNGKSQVEHDILIQVNHRNVIQIKESMIGKGGCMMKIFQELATGGDLFSYLSQDKKYLSKLPESEAIYAIYQICNGLMYLHENGIVHRDMKLDNILVMGVPVRYPRLKIGDFGIAKKHLPLGESQDVVDVNIDNRHTTVLRPRRAYWMNTIVGTAEYAAPEINLKGSGQPVDGKATTTRNTRYNEKVDSWSLGVISHILLSGISPFYSDELGEILEKSSSGVLHIDGSRKWDCVSDISKRFVKGCLATDPRDRLGIRECLRSEMFTHGRRRELIELLDGAPRW